MNKRHLIHETYTVESEVLLLDIRKSSKQFSMVLHNLKCGFQTQLKHFPLTLSQNIENRNEEKGQNEFFFVKQRTEVDKPIYSSHCSLVWLSSRLDSRNSCNRIRTGPLFWVVLINPPCWALDTEQFISDIEYKSSPFLCFWIYNYSWTF